MRLNNPGNRVIFDLNLFDHFEMGLLYMKYNKLDIFTFIFRTEYNIFKNNIVYQIYNHILKIQYFLLYLLSIRC